MARSILATALAKLLDETDSYSRSEWATICGVDQERIDRWTSDQELPKRSCLWVIWDIFVDSNLQEEPAALEFEELLDKPIREVTHVTKNPDLSPQQLASMTLREYKDWSPFYAHV